MFPETKEVIDKLDMTGIEYRIGGSVALYVQGSKRFPRDVDIMLTAEEHEKANIMFNLDVEAIVRDTVSMQKSSPVTSGSIDFLSNYKMIVNGKTYFNPPTQYVATEFESREIRLIPAEKIIVIKLLTLREHHDDPNDVRTLVSSQDFDFDLFWDMADAHNAKEIVQERLRLLNIHF